MLFCLHEDGQILGLCTKFVFLDSSTKPSMLTFSHLEYGN